MHTLLDYINSDCTPSIDNNAIFNAKTRRFSIDSKSLINRIKRDEICDILAVAMRFQVICAHFAHLQKYSRFYNLHFCEIAHLALLSTPCLYKKNGKSYCQYRIKAYLLHFNSAIIIINHRVGIKAVFILANVNLIDFIAKILRVYFNQKALRFKRVDIIANDDSI